MPDGRTGVHDYCTSQARRIVLRLPGNRDGDRVRNVILYSFIYPSLVMLAPVQYIITIRKAAPTQRVCPSFRFTLDQCAGGRAEVDGPSERWDSHSSERWPGVGRRVGSAALINHSASQQLSNDNPRIEEKLRGKSILWTMRWSKLLCQG